ncbi:MAG TPA: DUF86 domain-containing protein [Thermoanaerobaculia bacterium]|jgi:uncharacterized protein with HEPN domain|nr:DUF86 domain-containing protein [Thermoanaerobaculia bacterium]
MQRDQASLLDMLDAARLAVQYIAGKSYGDFLSDLQCQDAVIRRIELIGEAARRVSAETQDLYSQLPWREMVSMRNLMIHQYDEIDLSVVWDTVNRDLPGLIESLGEILHG